MLTGVRAGIALASSGALILSIDTLLLQMIAAPPVTVAFWRGLLMGITGIGAWLLISVTRGNARPLIMDRWAAFACVFYGVSSACFVFGALLTSTANLLVIVATAPLWAAIGSLVVFREPTPLGTWIASIVALGGIIIVVAPSIETGLHLGDFIALVTAWSMAAAFVVSRASSAHLASAPAIGGLLCAIMVMPFVKQFAPEHPYQAILMAIEGGVIVPVALGLIGAAPTYLPASQVGLFLLLETVLGPIWVWFGLGITPTMHALVGGAVVVSSLIANTLAMLMKRRPIRAG